LPFTPSHAAAAWAIVRLVPALPVAAVVAGTMAPDYEYLLRLAPRGRTLHSPLGLATLAVPAAVAAWLLWRQFVRPAVRAHFLPPGLRNELAHLAHHPLTGRELLAGVLGAALGAASHVFWDGITHGDGWAPSRWTSLYTHIALGAGMSIPIYQILQHVSTQAGGAAILLWFSRWWLRHPPASRAFAPGQVRRAVLTVAALCAVAALAAVLNATRSPPGRALHLGYAAVGAMTTFAVAALLWAIAQRRAA
jgi:hypothetical protein